MRGSDRRRCPPHPGPSGWRALGAAAALLAALDPGGASLTAQETPPAPLPAREVELPPLHSRTLANGAAVVVVPGHEAPFVTVDLLLPGGRAADPPGREGLAGITAGLLSRGTATRSADELAGAVDVLGGTLAASASADATTVSVAGLTEVLPELLGIMAETVVHPSFPDEEVERLRVRTLSALRAGLADPGVVADRAFLRTVYGDHAYGRIESEASVRTLDRDAVAAFHRRWYRPGRALFVVGGDVEPGEAVALLEEAFGGWGGGAPPPVEYGRVPAERGPAIVLVHLPGAATSAVRVGQTVMGGDGEGWSALQIANGVLGGGPGARLARTLRDERRLAPGAGSQLVRRRDRGFLRAGTEVPPTVTGEAVEALVDEIRRLREEMVRPRELREVVGFLAGSFPLQVETPRQVAARIASQRLLGLPDSTLSAWPREVAEVGPQEVKEVVVREVRIPELAVIVAGDASRVHRSLAALGPVRVVDVRGEPVEVAALVPRGRSGTLDASVLEPVSLEYVVEVEGREAGRVRRSLDSAPGPGRMVFRGEAGAGRARVTQAVTFTVPGFRPVELTATLGSPRGTTAMELRVEGGRLTGRVETGAETREVDVELPEGALLGDMVELAVWIAELQEGVELRMPVMRLPGGGVDAVPLRVTGREEITVPAGTFATWRVEIGGAQPQVVWARTEAPHLPVRIQPGAPSVVLELARLSALP